MAERETNKPPQFNPSRDVERLRVGRAVFGVRLHSLARESGLSIALLSQIERGRRGLTPDVRQKLFAALAQIIGKAA